MFTVHIYVEADSTAPRNMTRMTGYVLECQTASGTTKTVEGFNKKTGTYHNTILLALEDALKRLNQSCEIHIHSQNRYVLTSIDQYLHIWAGNGYRNRKGELIKNHFEWSRLWELLSEHLIVVEAGLHSYYSWMLSEMQRKAREIQEVPE